MIDFRYFLVSIVAIFFALAIGIVLGSGPLESNINNVIQGTNSQLAAEKKGLQEQIVVLQNAVAAGDTYAGSTASALLSGELSGQTVALVVLAGASDRQVEALRTAVDDSGARVGATVRLTDSWSDPKRQDVLGRIADGVDRGPSSGNAWVAAGEALAGALVTPSPAGAADSGRMDPQSVAVLTGFADAGFLRVDEERNLRRSGLAVVVAPDVDPDADQTNAALPLLAALDNDGRGTVLAGADASAADGGVVAAVRTGDSAAGVSTVDDLDLPMGPPTSVLALVEQLAGGVGQYGVHDGSDAVAPTLTGR